MVFLANNLFLCIRLQGCTDGINRSRVVTTPR